MKNNLTNTVASCGLVCGLCANSSNLKGSCAGCAGGGGDPDCEQRKCTKLKQINGCWECNEFPCDIGYLAESNVEWRGMCVASVKGILHHGIARFTAGMLERFPKGIKYAKYRFKSPEECETGFYDQDNTQPLN